MTETTLLAKLVGVQVLPDGTAIVNFQLQKGSEGVTAWMRYRDKLVVLTIDPHLWGLVEPERGE